MKKLLFTITAFLMIFSATQAQKNFEGKIVFETKYMGEGAETMAAFAPTGTIFWFRDQSVRLEMQGGMAAAMMGAILVDGKNEVSYMIKESEMVAYKISKDDDDESAEVEEKPEITKEDEVITILGHKCQKYKVVMNTEEAEITQYMWVASDIQVKKPKNSKNDANGMFTEGIDGLPLKKMTTMDMMGMTITTVEVATEIDDNKPAKELFEVPSNYEVKDFDPNMFGGMGN